MTIGKHQRAILTALRTGGELRMHDGAWTLHPADGAARQVDQARCMALFERGLIMADWRAEDGGWWYRLTTEGRKA